MKAHEIRVSCKSGQARDATTSPSSAWTCPPGSRDERGYPVPKFVEWIDGKPDFRCVDGRWLTKTVQQKLCWLCGEKFGRHIAFVIGPMCAINFALFRPPARPTWRGRGRGRIRRGITG